MIDGNKVMKLTGAQGPEIGRILNSTHEWILNDRPDATEREIEEFIFSIV